MMTSKTQNGFSLIELVIGVMAGTVVFFASAKVFVWMTGETLKAHQKITVENGIDATISSIRKQLFMPDARFLAFEDQFAGVNNLARFIVPQVNRCADLSVCEGNTALIFAFARSRKAMLSVPCPTVFDGDTIIVDLANTTYGSATANLPSAGRVTVSGSNGGVIDLRHKNHVPGLSASLLGIQDGPNITLWSVKTSMSPALSPVTVDTDGAVQAGGYAFSAECKNNFPFGTANLHAVKVNPISLAQFTGASAGVSNLQKLSSQNTTSKALFNVSVHSLGIVPKASPKPSALSVIECSYDATVFTCPNDKVFVSAPSVESLEIDAKFAIPLLVPGSPPTAQVKPPVFYQFADPGTSTPSSSCTAPITGPCATLRVDNAGIRTFRYFSSVGIPTEAIGQLYNDGFSFIKNDVLSALRFRFRTSLGKEGMFDVAF